MITLSDAKEFLRIDHAEEDGYISILLLLAREMCENYLRQSLPDTMPESIKQAMFLIIAHFYENRNGESVPNVIFRLLDPFRKEEF